MAADTLTWLQDWYRSQCDGEWEHDKGVRIDTLDNPGWSVEVDVGAIPPPTPILEEKPGNDWMRCEIRDGRFYGYGGPNKLQDILEVLHGWIGASGQDDSYGGNLAPVCGSDRGTGKKNQ